MKGAKCPPGKDMKAMMDKKGGKAGKAAKPLPPWLKKGK